MFDRSALVDRYVLALSSFGWTEMQVDAKAAESLGVFRIDDVHSVPSRCSGGQLRMGHDRK